MAGDSRTNKSDLEDLEEWLTGENSDVIERDHAPTLQRLQAENGDRDAGIREIVRIYRMKGLRKIADAASRVNDDILSRLHLFPAALQIRYLELLQKQQADLAKSLLGEKDGKQKDARPIGPAVQVNNILPGTGEAAGPLSMLERQRVSQLATQLLVESRMRDGKPSPDSKNDIVVEGAITAQGGVSGKERDPS
jgi:hypothetical protein